LDFPASDAWIVPLSTREALFASVIWIRIRIFSALQVVHVLLSH
jgi:hypothetical protein